MQEFQRPDNEMHQLAFGDARNSFRGKALLPRIKISFGGPEILHCFSRIERRDNRNPAHELAGEHCKDIVARLHVIRFARQPARAFDVKKRQSPEAALRLRV